MAKRTHEGTPIQLYIPDNAAELLDKVAKQRKAAGDPQASVSLLVREALAEKFGQNVEFFSTGKWGQRKDAAVTEQETMDLLVSRIQALGLPTPYGIARAGKRFDLAWGANKVAVEVKKGRATPAPEGWTVVTIKPTRDADEIDTMLRALPLKTT